MCVIIYKKRGFDIPSRNFLQRCWTANPDGAGFAYNDNKKVYYYKGFETFKKFYDTLLKCDKTAKMFNKDLIIHFRIATSGGTTPQKTHPFEISHSYKKMEKLQGTCKQAFFHNGIMADFASTLHSDTQNFNAMILSNIKSIEKQDNLIDYLARLNNSKFAIITRNKVMLGNDFLTDNNMLVSNKNYSYYYNTSYYNYDKTKYPYTSNYTTKNTKAKKQNCYLYDNYNCYDIYD